MREEIEAVIERYRNAGAGDPDAHPGPGLHRTSSARRRATAGAPVNDVLSPTAARRAFLR